MTKDMQTSVNSVNTGSKSRQTQSDVKTSSTRRSMMKLAGAIGLAGVFSAGATPISASDQSNSSSFDLVEATISDIHFEMTDGSLTAEELTQKYLARIEEYDDQINSIITVNDDAIERAKELDEKFEETGFVGPLHGIPILVKDNFDTEDLPTTGAAEAFDGTTPPDDAFTVAQLREAGVIILGKTNLPDFARGADGLSSLGGQTRNPYDLDYIPGGSSSGTGAGVSANLSVIGTATETGVSIRNPATNNGIVGVAPTRGLVSQDGIIPISYTQDRGGPHARTVSDAARMLEVMAGYDPQDPQTAESVGKKPDNYTDSLTIDSLEGARIGVIRELFGEEEAEEEVAEIINQAIDDLENAGATIIDPVPIQDVIDERLPLLNPAFPDEDDTSLVRLLSDARTNNFENEIAFNRYLETREDDFPFETLEEVIESGGVVEGILDSLKELPEDGIEDPEYQERILRINALQNSVLQTMAQDDLDALVYPMKTIPPRKTDGEFEESTLPASGNALSPITGFPSVVVPAGFNSLDLPEAIEFLGRPFSEKTLLEYAYAYEQATTHRKPPEDFGAL